MVTASTRAAMAIGLLTLFSVSARAQVPTPQAQGQSQRETEAQSRNKDAQLDKAQEASQRPSSPAACNPTQPPVPSVRVDRFGSVVTLFGTQEQPLYVQSELLVEVSGQPEGLFVRLGQPSDAESVSQPLDPTKPARFTRDQLMKFEQGGVVKLQVEATRPGVTERATVSTIWVIPYEPWTIVLNESGLVDPRFKGSAAAAQMPCDPVFVYAPTDPKIAPPFLTVTAPGAQSKTVTLNQTGCTVFRWPQQAGTATGSPAHLRGTCREEQLAPFLTDGQAQIVVVKEGRGLAVVSLSRQAQESFRPAPSTTEIVRGVQSVIFPILLDRTGVASWQYLNRRRPPQVSFTTTDAYLRFRNNIPDRQFVVTFSGIPETERAELVRQGIDVANCRDGKCQASVRIPSNGGAVLFPLVPLRNAFAKGGTGGLVSFQVSFFDEDTTPTNSRGYFTLVGAQQFVEAASATTWSAGASATYQRDPDMSGLPFTPKGHKSPSLTFATPWDRFNRSHVAGSATLSVRQTLGTRADLDVELTARKADFGSDASNVQASKYLANVYAVYALTLTGGRYDLAAPTSAIALSESGEAISGTYLLPKNAVVSVGRIFKKEMPIGSFTLDEEQKVVAAGGSFLERDHESTVLQVRDLFAVERFRLSLYGVIGDADRGEHYVANAETNPPTLALREFDVNYWTTGVDMVLGVKKLFVSAGLYHSRKSETRPPELPQRDDVSGNVGLVSVSYTNPDSKVVQGKQGIDWVLTGLIGAGGEYVGESQSFAPDVLFISTFSSALKEPTLSIGRGLTNKWYFGGVWTTPQFGWIKSLADNVPFLANDINSSSLTFKLHHYRLRNAVNRDSNLGTEGSLEFRVESPKGVRYQFTFAGFEPGEALDTPLGINTLIRKFQYAVRLGVTIRLE